MLRAAPVPNDAQPEDTSMLDERPALRTRAVDRDDRSMRLFEAALAGVAMVGAVLLAFIR